MSSIPFGRPILGEEEKQAVSAVMDSGILAHGKRLDQFEREFAAFTGAPHAVAVSNCTAAMHLVYFCLGIGPGDEVIVPAQTHVATAHAVELAGATPVFVDAEPRTGNIDIPQVEAAITPRTKAIAVVHFLGMPVDMAALGRVADQHAVPIIEDCALAIGSTFRGRHAGLHGIAGCFSFYPVKHITTAEGGMVITRDTDLAQKIRKARAFGMDKHVGERTVPGMYDVLSLGFNYRMNDVCAAIGVEQMKRVREFLKTRERNHQALSALLAQVDGLSLLGSSEGVFQSSYYCLSIMLDEAIAERRLEAIQGLRSRGVCTSIYYPQPVPRMSYYAGKYDYDSTRFPVAEMVSDRSIALPVGPHVSDDDVRRIADAVNETMHDLDRG